MFKHIFNFLIYNYLQCKFRKFMTFKYVIWHRWHMWHRATLVSIYLGLKFLRYLILVALLNKHLPESYAISLKSVKVNRVFNTVYSCLAAVLPKLPFTGLANPLLGLVVMGNP